MTQSDINNLHQITFPTTVGTNKNIEFLMGMKSNRFTETLYILYCYAMQLHCLRCFALHVYAAYIRSLTSVWEIYSRM